MLLRAKFHPQIVVLAQNFILNLVQNYAKVLQSRLQFQDEISLTKEHLVYKRKIFSQTQIRYRNGNYLLFEHESPIYTSPAPSSLSQSSEMLLVIVLVKSASRVIEWMIIFLIIYVIYMFENEVINRLQYIITIENKFQGEE